MNDRLETNVAGHYCIGDANGQSMLAHAASAQGVAAVENALGHAKPFDAAIPSAVYTFPEIAAVGMSEEEAKAAELPISIGRFPIGHLGKAMAAQHQEGFVKVIRHRETGELLGAHLIGHNATECVAAVTALRQQKVSVRDVAETVWAHPTISEAVKEAAEDALGMGLHLAPAKSFAWRRRWRNCGTNHGSTGRTRTGHIARFGHAGGNHGAGRARIWAEIVTARQFAHSSAAELLSLRQRRASGESGGRPADRRAGREQLLRFRGLWRVRRAGTQ